MKKSFKEILEQIKTLCDSVAQFAYNDLNIPTDEQYVTNQQLYQNWSKSRPDCKESYTIEYEEWLSKKPQPDPFEALRKRYLESINLYFEEVDSYGGEGQGDTWYVVYHFPNHDVYIRVDGYYQSYDGTEFYDGWGCCKEVKPVQKTITVYE